MRFRVFVTCICVLSCVASSVSATAIYVSPTGNDLTGTGSLGNPYQTINKGITMASAGDSVLLFDGTYSGNGNRNLSFAGKAITVSSRLKVAANVTVDCGGSPNRAFVFNQGETSSFILAHVTISNGDVHTRTVNGVDDKLGGGMLVSASPQIKNCIITGCRAQIGGGIFVYKSGATEITPLIDGCTFTHDSAVVNGSSSWGGAIACALNGSATISNCTFENNVSIIDGGAVHILSNVGASGVTIQYCSFYRNKARYDASGYGGAIATTGETIVKRCTFVENYADRGTALYAKGDSAIISFERNIVAFHSAPGVLDSSNGHTTYSCNDFWQNTGGSIVGTSDTADVDENTIFQDPLLCDQSSKNLYISSYSPCDEDSSKCDLLIGRFDNNCSRCCNKPGDVNNSGIVDLSDLSMLTAYLTTTPKPTLPCPSESNVDGSGTIDLTDLSALTAFLINGTPPPVCPTEN